MAYIGRQPTVGNFRICDAISVVDGQAAYTMQVGGVNVSPESANHMLVSLNGILQAPTSSFTVSSSTITFASNLVTGDVIDFIQILGNVLDLGVPSDSTVTTAKIVDANVTAAKMFSGFANGITEADLFRLTADISSDGDITSNLERCDDASYAKIGTGMSESSGIFTFPSTGLYQVRFTGYAQCAADDNVIGYIKGTTDNSSYDNLGAWVISGDGSTYGAANGVIECFFNVTNTSTHKIKFNLLSIGGGSAVAGSTTENSTFMTFVRLGDSQ